MPKLDVIDDFSPRLKHGFLSNFYLCTIYIDKKPFASIEHAYQAHKTLDESSRELIRKSKTPQEAKKLGKCVQLRSDWIDVRVPLMRTFLIQKFDNPFLQHMLIDTGDAQLIHANSWNDKFWGICRGEGENILGLMLMSIRSELMIAAEKDYFYSKHKQQ